jgi:hypothetical protein
MFTYDLERDEDFGIQLVEPEAVPRFAAPVIDRPELRPPASSVSPGVDRC